MAALAYRPSSWSRFACHRSKCGVSSRLAHEPAFEVVLRVAGGAERVDDFLAHLAAAAAEGRSDGRDQIRGICAESSGHRPDGGGNDLLHRAAPAGMNGGHRARSTVRQQDRRTVGHADDQRAPTGSSADDGIGLGRDQGPVRRRRRPSRSLRPCTWLSSRRRSRSRRPARRRRPTRPRDRAARASRR